MRTQSAPSNSSMSKISGSSVGRVVDDDQDLGLRVEVRPRTVEELLELEAARVGHGAARLPRRSSSVAAAARPRPRRPAAPCPARAARVAGDRRARGPRPRSAGSAAGREQRRQLGLDVERRLAAAHAARVARLEHLADLGLALGRAAAAPARLAPAGRSPSRATARRARSGRRPCRVERERRSRRRARPRRRTTTITTAKRVHRSCIVTLRRARRI